MILTKKEAQEISTALAASIPQQYQLVFNALNILIEKLKEETAKKEEK